MKKIIWIVLLIGFFGKGQELNMTSGFTDVSNRVTGSAINWNFGYSHFFESYGFAASYGKVIVTNLNYANANFFAMYRIKEKSYSFSAGPGVNWNDENNKC